MTNSNKVIKKLTKDQKIRMNLYSQVATALEASGIEILGKSKKGLVINDGLVEIAVVVKKVPVTEYGELVTVAEHNESLKAYQAEKAKAKAEEEEE